MKKSLVWQCLTIILVLTILTGSTGCNSEVKTQKIVDNVLSAYTKVRTYSVVENMAAKTEVIGGDRPGTRLTSQNGTGTIDIENRQLEMDILQDGQPMQKTQAFTKMFLVNEWLYIKRDILDYEDKDHEIWVKLDLDDEQLNQNDRLWVDNNPLAQQIKLLDTAREVTFMRDEDINGMDNWVLEIKPDWQVLTDWLSFQPPWTGHRFFNLPELAKSLLFRLWVCKDNYLITKSMIEIDYETVSFNISKSTVELKGEVNFNDYDEPCEIKLPVEAQRAVRGPIS
jgi:hypothetical protein